MGCTSSVSVEKKCATGDSDYCRQKREEFFDSKLILSACENGKMDVLLYLLANEKVNLNVAYTHQSSYSYYSSYSHEHRRQCDIVTRTHLIEACKNNNIEIVNLLLDNKVNINVQGSTGTALYVACSNGYYELAKLLLERGAITGISDKIVYLADKQYPNDCVHRAYQNTYFEIVKLLLAHGAKPTNDCLMDACIKSDIESIKLFLTAGGEVTVDCLHLACRMSHLELAKLFLATGAKPNENCLLLACNESKPEFVKLFLEGGAPISKNVLSLVTKMEKNNNNNEITKMVLGHGCLRNPSLPTAELMTYPEL